MTVLGGLKIDFSLLTDRVSTYHILGGCQKITDLFMKGLQWPASLGGAIANGDSSFGC